MTDAAPQVVIRRCVLRIARRGGWSWGPDPARVKRAAVERLPALLAQRIARLATTESGEDVEITAPIVLCVPIRAREWMELVNAPGTDRPSAVLDVALARALDMPGAASSFDVKSRAAAASKAAPTEISRDESSRAITDSVPSALLAMLLRWREEGSLARELAMLDVEVLATWLKRLVGVEVAPAAASSVVQDATVAEIAARVDAIKMLVPRGAARDRARELLFVVEYFAIHGVDAVAARVALRAFRRANVAAGMADDLVDTNPEIAVHKQRDVVSVARTAAEIGATRNVAASSSQTRPRESFEIEVPCALPFLLLGPLGRTGYFERLAAMLDAARASAHAHGFAHALARKVLAPPARGWLRTAGDIAAAAALAARADCDEESIANVGQALRSQLAVLDGCIADRLIADHRETAGWFIALASHGDAVLFDEDGLVPVAFGEPEALALRIAPSCNTKGQERCEEALNGLSALRDERPALRPHVNDAFENTVTLAASYALGVIAWTLWSTRERPTPAMALHTFADLDARVHVTRGEIHVALPLGRRFWDLRDHGLLADVRGLPWLPETRVTFGTG